MAIQDQFCNADWTSYVFNKMEKKTANTEHGILGSFRKKRELLGEVVWEDINTSYL